MPEQQTFEDCMTGEYNQTAEAVQFMWQIVSDFGADTVQWIKDNWAYIAGAGTAIGVLIKFGAGSSAVVALLAPLVPGLAGGALDLLVAAILGLGLAAVLLAIEAAVECAVR